MCYSINVYQKCSVTELVKNWLSVMDWKKDKSYPGEIFFAINFLQQFKKDAYQKLNRLSA